MNSELALTARRDATGLKLTFRPLCSRIRSNNTRQGYALRSTLKPAGYFFLGR